MQAKWQDKISPKSSVKESPPENEGVGTVLYITGEDMEGQPQWAYALIHADKYLDFKEAEARGNYQLAEFGKVLHFGAGTEPPAHIKQEMAEKYNCNEQFEQEIEELLKEIIEEIMPEEADSAAKNPK